MIQAHVADYKKEAVGALARLMGEYPVVGIVNVENLPAPQLQVLRSKLRKDALIVMDKKRLIRLAVDSAKGSKSGFDALAAHLTGMPALLFTTQSPFRISSLIRSSKSRAPAKAGQVAPFDLVIPAGPTPFTPGPMISELGSLGLKTGVEGGKITIREASAIVRQGGVISQKAAEMLGKFGIEPMEIGLDLVAAYEDGIVYGRDVLAVDPAQYLAMLKTAALEALGLSMEIGYINKGNIEHMVGRAFTTAKNFAKKQSILSDADIEGQLAEAAARPAGAPEKSVSSGAVPAHSQSVSQSASRNDVPKTAKSSPSQGSSGLAAAERISNEFSEEIAAEKARRENIDTAAAGELLNKLKRKGTLRQ